ncbi:E3 ubiquitin-protein ligase EL5-like [Oryza brachyantha]|uniref:E3 ubiquitin-protein ligase EL5-like n=1 Tax=Oryza brachyantha TaxID=4533 RepID=UPI001ADC5EA5|nr:E3 ubiquitin-protein ligase EL5-like [Oryza brachyantha]
MVRGVEQGGSSSSAAAAAAVPPAGQAAMTVGGIVTVATVLLVFAAFTLAFVLLQCYCDDRRRAVSTSGRRRRRPGGPVAGSGGGGVDPEVLRSLPVTVYRAQPPAAAKGEDGVECAVCLAELEDGEEARFLPRCGHGFHAECVDVWLESHSTCPLCRLTVVPSPPPPLRPPLPPVPPEPPANYTVNLPASFLLGLSDQHQGAVTMTPEDSTSPSAGATAVLVIEVPDPEPAASTPRNAAARSPGLARLRSLKRLWSFGRQGAAAGSTSSCNSTAVRVDGAVDSATPTLPLPEADETGARTTAAAVYVRNCH